MKRVLKWIGYIVGGLVVVIVLCVGTVYAITSSRIGKSYSTTIPPLAIPADSASIARGKHLVENVGKCQGCHGDDYAGKIFEDDPAFMRLTTANITSGKGGIGGTYTDEDWVRTIRYGINREGKSVLFMPAEHYTHLNDIDLGQMIAYLKTLPPADMTIEPKRSVGPVGRMVYLFAGLPLLPASLIDRNMARPVIPEGNTVEYGKYLIDAGGCRGCHSDNLGGGVTGSTRTPNLTRSGELGKWTEADFAKAIRNGVRPDGRILSAQMPWPYMRGLTDTELGAMWKYLQSAAPAPLAR